MELFSYGNGVIVSLIIAVWQISNLLATLTSQAERNLRSVGMRYGWMDLKPKDIHAFWAPKTLKGQISKFLIVISLNLMASVLSWLNVLFYLFLALRSWYKDRHMPDSVKEVRWRVKNVPLSQEALIQGFLKVQGLSGDAFLYAKEKSIHDLRNKGIGYTSDAEVVESLRNSDPI